jgi:hypothetical protein
VLADHNGKIIGSIQHRSMLVGGGYVNEATGDEYLTERHAQDAIERAAQGASAQQVKP